MPNLQKLFAYLGDADHAPLTSIHIQFEIPVFKYSIAGLESDGTVEREIVDAETLTVSQAINSKQYRVVFSDEFAIGKDDATLALFKKYFQQSRVDNSLDNLVIGVTVHYLSDDGYELAQQPLEFIHFPKLDLDAFVNVSASASVERRSTDPIRKVFIAVNKTPFLNLHEQLAAVSVPLDEITLMEIISYLTDLKGDEPIFQKTLSSEAQQRLFALIGANSADDAKKAIETIKAAFPSLYDFPLSLPELNALNIAGKLTIVTTDNSNVSKQDFMFYDLSAECSVAGNDDLQILHYTFGENLRIQDNSSEFSLTDDRTLLRNSVVSLVSIKLKAFDGSLLWSKAYKADDPRLGRLAIEVPLQRANTLVPPDKDLVHNKTKKLRGQVLELSKKCPLKDLTVVIQAKAEGDTLWRIVGAATTDSAGNFSMLYPFGIFTAAQALVSASPDSPAVIRVTEVREGNQTIADDFLYLLIKDMECPHIDTEEDCDCHSMNKASRLPDQADLIGSKEYSQDLGGACVNLSTPNRTLSEFNYQAIVRTSDPDVANYTLKKVDVVQAGIGPVPLSEILRVASALLSAVKNPLFGNYYLSQKLLDTEAKIDTVRNLTASVSTDDLTTALKTVDAVIYQFNAIVPESQVDVFNAFKSVQDLAKELKARLNDALLPRTETHYELVGGANKRVRKPVDLDNPVSWQDAPDDQKNLSLYQAVTIATGHLLHYKSVFKADGYSLGELIYSLPLAPGQKKEIVVFDSSHRLAAAESQSLSQGERLAAGIVDERNIADQLGGSIGESLRGSSSANTSGISAGFGTGGSGSGGTGAYGGSGSAVLGVAGGVANANSSASQDSSRTVSQFFGEKLRQSIMQNAEAYRQLNASVVTTVQEGQRYGVTSEVVANHNHCHALTMMYFEVLRHYAIFQELSSVEECIFVPLLMTNFTTQNIYKWRDVLAKFLLPMPAETYLQPFSFMRGSGRQHPLLKAFDANERIKTNYANVDYPEGSYDDEPIRFLKG